jgi:hypothetical protein
VKSPLVRFPDFTALQAFRADMDSFYGALQDYPHALKIRKELALVDSSGSAADSAFFL